MFPLLMFIAAAGFWTSGTISARRQTAPDAPTIGTAIGISRAVVSFTPPASDDGSPITGYTVTSSPGGITGTGTTSPIFVPGLTGGTAYTFTVTATNAHGTSSASAASNSMTPSSTLIPADNLTDWSYAGAGGIPTRTTVCATFDAATYGYGTIDAGPAIKAAIDACPTGQVVSIGAGAFLVNSYILHNKAVTVRGQGIGITVLKRTLVPQMPIMVIGGSRGTALDHATAVNLTTDAVKGAFSVDVANPTGFAAGQFVLLNEDDLTNATYVPMPPGQPTPTSVLRSDRIVWDIHDPPHSADCSPSCMGSFTNIRPGRAIAEVKEIASVSGNTITFATPFHITYRTAYQSQLVRYMANNPFRTGAGLEDLTMIGGTEGNLRFSGAAKSWAKGIECAYATQPCIAINDSTRIEVRDSFLHENATRAPGGGGYLFSLQEGASEVLIENNVHITGNKVMVARAAGAGSVVGYNYMDNALISYNYGWMEAGINGSHFAGSHHILFEGNLSFSYASDDTWGNAILMTVFRNHFTGARRDHPDTNMVNTVAMASGSYWHTLVGNVFGTPEMPPSGGGGTGPMAWVYEDLCDGTYGSGPAMVCGNPKNPAIYRLGFFGKFWYTPGDPQVMSTIVRERNWDYVTDSVRSDRASPSTLPNSLYLSGKPSFFETADMWPWVDAVGATKTYTLPAKRRYDAYRASGGGAGYSHTQSQYHHLTPAAPSHTFTSNNTAGRSIIVGAGWIGADVPTIADTRGNTYTLVVTRTNTSGFSSAIWAAHSIAAGANTVTLTHATSEIDAVFAEYAGLTGTDKAAGKPRSGGVPTSSGTDPTTTANQMVFGFVMSDLLTKLRPAAGPTFTGRATGESATHYVGAEDKRTNVMGSYEADFTAVGSVGQPAPAEQQWIVLVATFKEAVGSPVAPTDLVRVRVIP